MRERFSPAYAGLEKSSWLQALWLKAGLSLDLCLGGGGAPSCLLMAFVFSSSHYFTKTYELGCPAFICAKYKWKNKLNTAR